MDHILEDLWLHFFSHQNLNQRPCTQGWDSLEGADAPWLSNSVGGSFGPQHGRTSHALSKL